MDDTIVELLTKVAVQMQADIAESVNQNDCGCGCTSAVHCVDVDDVIKKVLDEAGIQVRTVG